METVLVTGASDGIGRELARLYAGRGARVIGVGRRPTEALVSPPHPPSTYLSVDLSQPEAASRIAEALDGLGVTGLDALVHGAAVGHWGEPSDEPPERALATLAVDLRTPIALTQALLPRVLAARGSVVFVSSVAAALPAADFAVYAAAKAGLEGFARALRVERRGRATVTVVRPGATRTGMHAKAGVPSAKVSPRWPTAERVAAGILRATRTRRREVTLGWGNRLAVGLGRLAGRPLDALLRWSRCRAR